MNERVDPVAEAERVVTKWRDRVEALRVSPHPKDRERLARAELRLQDARSRLSAIRERQAKRSRTAGAVGSLLRHADRIIERLPSAVQNWKRERAEEPKRIAKRKKELRKRTAHDQEKQKPEWWRRPPKLPAPVQQPAASDLAEANAPPPRPDLLPGEYTMIGVRLLDPGVGALPKEWTVDHVEARMAEAHEVLRRLPMTTRPKEFGAIWPEYQHEAGELVHQAASGTLELGRNRIIRGTSADEVARMNEALAWPMQYLQGDRDMAFAVNELAFWAKIDPSEAVGISGWSTGLRIIAAALNVAKVVVR